MNKMILSSLALAVLTGGSLLVRKQRKAKEEALAKLLRMPGGVTRH